ncbi:uncharacterized protein B0P05DRAFT_501509 [Gilbertella persicaria]|uniref:uncharacterized protein n=1 Tax=Gilbertella persicaria TaxID=101096 RepID=UPI00221FB0FF|nr:uncharacterized protein B0P05DRAFT_501509 [Gilbertella persicaria]KAI8098123.1 hypothetical protein B0P05DRAFT_501509 [Gilbertella persicaria]
MTDSICHQEGCHFPLMKSKDGSLSFCTHHDPLPNQGASHNYKDNKNVSIPVETKEKESVLDDGEEELKLRRQRREQSSKASQLIGQKMLQRWALLNEHCPNTSCYAVPLVRNPDTQQMYCVICENIILTEQEALEKKLKETPKPVSIKGVQSIEKAQSIQQEPIKQEPIKQEPTKQEPTKQEPIQHQPIKQEPANPIPSQATKRQKVDTFPSDSVVATLSDKLNELTERVKTSHDPIELSQLFKSIKQCAGAIQACVEASRWCDKMTL